MQSVGVEAEDRNSGSKGGGEGGSGVKIRTESGRESGMKLIDIRLDVTL